MDKYIFLDIDDVIAVERSHYNLDMEKCDLIQHIIDETGAKIVITSSWRRHNLEATKDALTHDHTGLTKPKVPFTPSWVDDIVGVTIRAYQYIIQSIHLGIPRGVEIKQWLDTHVHSDNGHNFDHKIVGEDFTYVIIDDDDDMLLEHQKHFVKVKRYKGISRKDAEKAIRILNNQL